MLAMLVSLLAHAAGADAQVYRWRDADGRTHYSDRPPAAAQDVRRLDVAPPPAPAAETATEASEDAAAADDTDADLTAESATTPSSDDVPAASPPSSTRTQQEAQAFDARHAQRASEEAAAAAAAARAEQRRQYCDSLRHRLAALESGQRVARFDAAGGREFLDDGERAAESARLRQRIAADCH